MAQLGDFDKIGIQLWEELENADSNELHFMDLVSSI